MFKLPIFLFLIVFVCLLFATLDSKKVNKNSAKKDQGKEIKVKKDIQKVREVRSIKTTQDEKQPKENYQKTLSTQTQTLSEGPQLVCPEAVQAPIQQTHVIKLQKVKAIKAITEYELCKQECRRKRDMESTTEYVDVLREELRLAEQQMEIQKENEKLEQTIANATAENLIKLAEKPDVV